MAELPQVHESERVTLKNRLDDERLGNCSVLPTTAALYTKHAASVNIISFPARWAESKVPHVVYISPYISLPAVYFHQER